MRQSALIGLLPALLAALTIAAPVIDGVFAPLAGRADADSASVYTVDKRSDADAASVYNQGKRNEADSATVYKVDKRSDADGASVYSID